MRRGLWLVVFAFGSAWGCVAADEEVAEPGLGAEEAEIEAGASSSGPGASPTEAEARGQFRRLPLRYEANHGQHDPRARYVARQGALTLFATDEGPVLAVRARTPSEAGAASRPEALAAGGRGQRLGLGDPEEELAAEREPAPSRVYGLRLRLEGARPGAVEPGARLVTRSNYFIGNDPAQWRTNVPNYASLTYTEHAPGVDLVLHSSPEGRIEYDFVVAPGADPEALSVRFEGADEVRLGEEGALEVHVGELVLSQPAPVLYQELEGQRLEIEGRYRMAGGDRVAFEVGAYDRERPLVIDPVLVYSTYLGGSASDHPENLAVDGEGAAYVVGHTISTDFPVTAGAVGEDRPSGTNGFVAKLSPDGASLEYATYLGGSSDDEASSVAVDTAGAAYVVGRTWSGEVNDFPTTEGAFETQHRTWGWGGFVTKLSPDGSELTYSTYLLGSYLAARGVAVDAAGAAYVVGETGADLPATTGVLQEAYGGSGDAFVAKLSPDGASLTYATFLGGSARDVANAVVVDAAGAAYVVGVTRATDFPATEGAVEETHQGGVRDGFAAKVSPDGASLTYATYLGGWSSDEAFAVAVDAAGAAYVVGETYSGDFPTTVGAFEERHRGGIDAFVAKLSPSGDSLAYSTYLGGFFDESARGVAVDETGAAYVVGPTTSAGFPTTEDAFEEEERYTFVTRLGADGASLSYSTFLGGSRFGGGGANDVALGGPRAVYVLGSTWSSSFPTRGAIQPMNAGERDAFVTKLDLRPALGQPCEAEIGCRSGHCVADLCAPTPCGDCDDGNACTVNACDSAAVNCTTSPVCDPATACTAEGADVTCSECPAGTYSADGTGATSCLPCPAGQWSAAGATTCTAWTTCAAGTFSSTAGTATSDRDCATCRVCGPMELEVGACTATQDATCEPFTPDAGTDAGIEPRREPGCGCRAASPQRPAWPSLLGLLLGGVVLVRRRGHSASRR